MGYPSLDEVLSASCIVASCVRRTIAEVAVKVIAFDSSITRDDINELTRKMRRELGLWRRLDHPNIVPFLGTVCGRYFGSDHPSMVAIWMPNGTLSEYIKKGGTTLSLLSRTRLVSAWHFVTLTGLQPIDVKINGTAAGLEYLHSQCIVHGDFHPGNILIDGEHNARLADFGFSQTLSPGQDQLSYLWTDSVRPGAVMWAAPELLYPKLYPDFKVEATLNSDIYSLGGIILFILSGRNPWKDRAEMESKLKEFENPPPPVWPVIPDGVWDFIERCWSLRLPSKRPSAREALSFSTGKLEQLLQPNPASVINVVLFGATGCGKSSIINLLAENPIVEVPTDVDPCTKRPRWHEIFIGNRQMRLCDTMGFRLAREGDTNPLLPYKQAHTVLRNLTDGVNLILLCARKDEIFASLGGLYRLIKDFFYGGRARPDCLRFNPI
ncbi:kinase-like protein [Imleria badia]|nr:kinase-like protein [Imleria badia]